MEEEIIWGFIDDLRLMNMSFFVLFSSFFCYEDNEK